MRSRLEAANNKYNNLLCFNRKMMDDNNQLIRTLEKYKNEIQEEEYQESIRIYRQFYEEITEERQSVMISTIRRSIIDEVPMGSSIVSRDAEVGDLVAKLSRYEGRNQELVSRVRVLEGEVNKSTEEVRIKNSIIKRLENDFEDKLSRAREELAKNPNLNRELSDENKRLQERSRKLERDVANEKQNAEKAQREVERAKENVRRECERQWDRKERELRDASERERKEFEREISQLAKELERLRADKNKLDQELGEVRRRSQEEIRHIRESQMSGATDKHNQLLSENVELRERADGLQREFDEFRRTAIDNETANEKELNRLRD